MVIAILDFQNLISEQWVPLSYRFSNTVPNLAQKCRSTPKLWPKIEIQDGGLPPSWISENLIFEHYNPLGFRFSISVKNLVQKCRSTPKLWPKIEIQDGGLPPSWIFENPISEHWDPLGCRFSISIQNKIWCKNVDQRQNYNLKSKSKVAAFRHLGLPKIWFLSTATPWDSDFLSLYQIWRKMSIDAEIMAENRNPTWRPSAQDGGRPPSWMFENPTSEHWNPLDCRFSISVQNLVPKCWSIPKL